MSLQIRVFLKKNDGAVCGCTYPLFVIFETASGMISVPTDSFSATKKFETLLITAIAKVEITPHTRTAIIQALHHSNLEISFAPERHIVAVNVPEWQLDHWLGIIPRL